MAGYLAGATAEERPLQDLLRVLPEMLSQEGTTTGYAAFGLRLAPQGPSDRDALMRPEFYTCKGAAPGRCDNQESRFDLVLRDIQSKPADLALLVSDLWLVNSTVQTSALTDLAAPLAAILEQGRAIAVYGIPARYRGPIYDLPASPGKVQFDGRHPLYLVAIGSDEQLDRLDDRMKRNGSAYLARALGDGTIRHTLFTLHPRLPGPADAEPLVGRDPAVARTPVIASVPGVRVQQLEIARSGALRSRSTATGMTWTGPVPGSFRPNSVWSGGWTARTRVWERRGDRCRPADWIEGRPLDGLWRPAGTGQMQFRLDPRVVATGVAREGTYLITGELRRASVETPNPASAWLRAWSFSAGDDPAGRTLAGERFFPTLHGAEVARLMENALADAARRRQEPIAGFDVVVRIRN